MSHPALNLLLIPALLAPLACSRPGSPCRVAIEGRILGADGQPLPMAHARIWTDPFHPHLTVQADSNGRFRLKTALKPGVYRLDFSGVGHRAMDATLWVDRDRDFRVEARLGVHRLLESPKELLLEARDEGGRVTQTPMALQADGTWAAELKAAGSLLRTRVRGAAALVEGIPFRFGVNGTQAEGFDPTEDHNYWSLVRLREGRAHVVFDPRALPKGELRPRLAFDAKDGDLAVAWALDAEILDISLEATRVDALRGEARRQANEACRARSQAFRARCEAALAAETRPRVRLALGAALLGRGKDPAPLLRAFPPEHPFWRQVGDTDLAIAAWPAGRPDRQTLLTLILDRREPDSALRILQILQRSLPPWEAEPMLAELEALRPGHPALKALRGALEASRSRLAVGQPFPRFQLPSLEDPKQSLSLDAFKGKWLLVDVWATWCKPCVAELPGLHKAFEAFKGRGLEVLSLSFDVQPGDIQAFRASQKLPMPWKHAWLEKGSEHAFARSLEVTTIPRVFLVGPDGTIRAMDGELKGPALEKTLARLLAKP